MPVGRTLSRNGKRPPAVALTGAAAVVAWTPAQISPTGWWDAQDAATLTTASGAVSAWANKGSQGGFLGNSTASARPVLSASQIGSYPALTFSSGQFLEGSLSSTASVLLIAGVAVMNTPTSNFHRTISLATASTDDYNLVTNVSVGLSAANPEFVVNRNQVMTSSAAITFGQPFIYVASFDGANENMRVNGTSINTQASSGAFGFNAIRMMNGYGGGVTNPTPGKAAEHVIAETAALANIQKLEGYLAARWGLQSLLPAGHPYKTGAP